MYRINVYWNGNLIMQQYVNDFSEYRYYGTVTDAKKLLSGGVNEFEISILEVNNDD